MPVEIGSSLAELRLRLRRLYISLSMCGGFLYSYVKFNQGKKPLLPTAQSKP